MHTHLFLQDLFPHYPLKPNSREIIYHNHHYILNEWPVLDTIFVEVRNGMLQILGKSMKNNTGLSLYSW